MSSKANHKQAVRIITSRIKPAWSQVHVEGTARRNKVMDNENFSRLHRQRPLNFSRYLKMAQNGEGLSKPLDRDGRVSFPFRSREENDSAGQSVKAPNLDTMEDVGSGEETNSIFILNSSKPRIQSNHDFHPAATPRHVMSTTELEMSGLFENRGNEARVQAFDAIDTDLEVLGLFGNGGELKKVINAALKNARVQAIDDINTERDISRLFGNTGKTHRIGNAAAQGHQCTSHLYLYYDGLYL